MSEHPRSKSVKLVESVYVFVQRTLTSYEYSYYEYPECNIRASHH